MARSEPRFDVSKVDVSDLETDAEFAREAKRHVDAVLEHLGADAAEMAWNAHAIDNATAGKQRFIEQGSEHAKTAATAEDRQRIEDAIIQQLRAKKASQ